ncbi:ribonucleotide reductase subunit 1 [Cyprinid herpesvirus 3]|nr:ribonucleotide reductase subunit 1 [Cyprinid herpesvirus 3]
MEDTIYVTKRDGTKEPLDMAKVVERINECGFRSESVDPQLLAQKIEPGIGNGCKTSEIDELLAHTASNMTTTHPDYSKLAARIAVTNLHKLTSPKFSEVCKRLWFNVNPDTGLRAPLIAQKFYEVSQKHAERLDAAVRHHADFGYSYFGFKTLERSYMLKGPEGPIETPQHTLMRCALQIHGDNIDALLQTYGFLSSRYFTHASPTLFNSCSPKPQLSSCFLLNMKSDSMEGIADTIKSCALISKHAGGLGMSISNLRGKGAYIKGTNGHSNGIVPTLRIFNALERMVDQGGNKRPGALAVYMEPWHVDVFDFLELRKNTGSDEQRTRDLFQALWIPDLFMQRVKDGGEWSLMCPASCPGLDEVWGPEFEALYTRYEAEGKARRTVKARDLWNSVLVAQLETGGPFMLYKDACNRKSNHQHLGTIKCSNLCTEIVQYTNSEEVAVCNLASVALNEFVRITIAEDPYEYDFQLLADVVRMITRNLNKVIDGNFYPVPEAMRSNKRHRPIGIGVQGLADVFMMMGIPFTCGKARDMNKMIFETIYYAALDESCKLAQRDGPYPTYEGSPVSKGLLQFDMWGLKREDLSGMWDWNELRLRIQRHGVRNSLLVSPMPTASTAQILGNTESIEPLSSNLYQRRVLSGEFQVVNRHLVEALERLGLWNDNMRTQLIVHKGSVQNIEGFPEHLKPIYKTAYEISQKDLITMAAERAPFVDQSQSLNLFLCEDDPKLKMKKLTAMHLHAWSSGLKTGMYYLRTKAAVAPVQFSVAPEVSAEASRKRRAEDGSAFSKQPKLEVVCNEEVCTMCSS